MKTFIFSALALGMMASCANTDVEGVSTVDNGEPVAIQLSAGVQQNVVVSRAPITNGGKFIATVLGWEAKGDVSYSADTTWMANTNEISALTTGEDVVLVTPKFYNPDIDVTTYMKAYSPVGTVTGGTYTFTSLIEDGTQDVLVSNEVTGSRSDADVKAFKFTHPLTQLQFVVKGGDGWTSGAVKSIALKAVKVATGVKVTDNSLVTKDEASLDVSGIDDAAGVEVVKVVDGVKGTNAGSPIMIVPTTGKEITIDVTMVSGITYKGIKVTSADATFAAGKAYTITLTFQNKKVSGTATVEEWATGGEGSGIVQ